MSNHALFEIGVEELPARFIDEAEKQLKNKTEDWLKKHHITYDNVKTYSTPRRLAILIHGIATYQTTITEEVRGPQEKIAKDNDGNWSKAAIGFTKGQRRSVEDIYLKEIKGTSYIFVKKRMEGKKTEEILPGFTDIITSISFPQTMNWGSDTFQFARPIRWLVALLNDHIIPFEVAHVKSDRVTYGHRFLGEKSAIHDPLQYETILEENYVIADPNKREKMIVDQLNKLEEKEGFHIAINQKLLQEVRNLVEYPTVFHGEFEVDYLKLPPETLITSMQEHQRYFPVLSEKDGTLLPYFVSVRNGDKREIANVVRGNEKVLRARLADAAFFYEEDRKYSIDIYMDKLKSVVFQEKIGTIYEKSQKIKQITTKINEQLKLDQEETEQTLRAAEICKFDLVTDMVNEFPELQGIIGEKYALHYGENENVAQAIREHYLPVQANGDLPETVIGSIVSVADKLDTIVGCISVGLIPTGSQDPYSLRRQAIGVLRILTDQKWNISVEHLVNIAQELYDIKDEEMKQQLEQFIKNRAAYLLQDQNIEQDVIQAVLSKEIGVIHYTIDKANVLSHKRNETSFKNIQEALVRVMNLGKKHTHTEIDPTLFETESEKELFNHYEQVKEKFLALQTEQNAEEALTQLGHLAEPIHTFFDHTMVMAEDLQLKNNRLALVHHISNLTEMYADMTLIEWKQHM